MDSPSDLNFECRNPDCGIISCRSCRIKTHSPKSCEGCRSRVAELTLEDQRENKLAARHEIEEAMTAALVRICNACKRPFLKEEGCNHMICSCGNDQCFVCSENIHAGYGHFGDLPRMCPQYDNTDERLQMEVASAQVKALQEVLGRQTEWTEAEVTVDATLLPDIVEIAQRERAQREREVREQWEIHWMVEEAVRRAVEREERVRARRARAKRARTQRARERAQRGQREKEKRARAQRQAKKEEQERQERVRRARKEKRQRRRRQAFAPCRASTPRVVAALR